MSSESYQFWLTGNAGKEKMRFPVLPETIKVKIGNKNSTTSIVGLGEVTTIQERDAIKISWSCFFPSKSFPGIQVEKLDKPMSLVKKIKKWMESDKPVMFTAVALKLNMYCTISDFSYDEKGGDVGTINYSISLKEYIEPTVRKINKKKKKKTAVSGSKNKRVNNKSAVKTHTVVKGDSLWSIARKYLGSGTKYKKIYEANKKKIGKNMDSLKVGTVLIIPN